MNCPALRAAPIVAFVVAALGTVPGCGLEQPYVAKRLYAFDPGTASVPTSSRSSGIVRVACAGVSPPFASRGLQYRVAQSRFESTYYDAWSDDPGGLLAAATASALEATGAWMAVVPEATVAADAWTLELSVDALYADVVTSGQPEAVIALRATLIDPSGRVAMTDRFVERVPAGSAEPSEMVAAWNDALDRIHPRLFEAMERSRRDGR